MLKKRAFKSLNLLILLVIVLVGVRLALPSWVKNYLNDQLAAMGEYQGHIADVDIALWRGAYVIHELNIVKTSEKVPVPFFEARSIDLSISWRALWAGQVVADVEFSRPELHFVDGKNSQSQSGSGTDWQAALQQ